MRTPDPKPTPLAAIQGWRSGWNPVASCCVLLLVALASGSVGCKKDLATQASDSDANGYLCLKCGAKLYTDRSVFIGPKCSKCQQETLVEVVGYLCAKDQYLTIRARAGDPKGASVCEKCQTPLHNSMFLPREKDLKAWGATRTSA